MTDMLNDDTNKVSCRCKDALQHTDIQILVINIDITDGGSRSGLHGDSGTRTKIQCSHLPCLSSASPWSRQGRASSQARQRKADHQILQARQGKARLIGRQGKARQSKAKEGTARQRKAKLSHINKNILSNLTR
jgi:hypothetical protein